MILKGVCWMTDNEKITGDLRVKNGLIHEINNNLPPRRDEQVLELGNHFLYPGLINAHDHLEMNLYPNLGDPPYTNYVAWASDIYRPAQSPILEIEKTERKDRLLWGGIKNLISGVTSVVHHNPWHRILGSTSFPVTVVRKITWAHSLALEKRKFPAAFKNTNLPFVIHAAEGIDEMAYSEIQKLEQLGLIRKNTVLVHTIAAAMPDIEIISRRRASVVWCPGSNKFMFGQTAPIRDMKGKVRIALGTDSTLTGSPTMLDEMQSALQTNLATAPEIYQMVTRFPAEIFNLPVPSISVGQPADLFVSISKDEDYFQNLLHLQPADIVLVMVRGKLKLLDQAARGKRERLNHEVRVQGRVKSIDVDVAKLKKRIEKKVTVAVLENNPLWKLIEA